MLKKKKKLTYDALNFLYCECDCYEGEKKLEKGATTNTPPTPPIK